MAGWIPKRQTPTVACRKSSRGHKPFAGRQSSAHLHSPLLPTGPPIGLLPLFCCRLPAGQPIPPVQRRRRLFSCFDVRRGGRRSKPLQNLFPSRPVPLFSSQPTAAPLHFPAICPCWMYLSLTPLFLALVQRSELLSCRSILSKNVELGFLFRPKRCFIKVPFLKYSLL